MNAKLVIRTQYRENYAAHNDDYEHGVSAPYWKNKGGDTYVVYGITESMSEKIFHRGIPTLTKLIEFNSEYAEEFIIETDIVPAEEKVVDDWDHEIVLSYDKTIGAWRACFEREPYSPHLDHNMVSESWVMDEGNTRVPGTYHKLYRKLDGHWVSEHDLYLARELV